MSRIRAVAFDFDDTISDWPRAVVRAVDLLALEVPDHERASFPRRFLRVAAERYPSRNPGPLFFEAQDVIADVIADTTQSDALGDRFRTLVRPVAFDDVVPVLTSLAGTYRLAVLSNNPYAPEGLRLLGLDRHFGSIIALHESDPRAKPSVTAFEMLSATLDVGAFELLYVGDSILHDVAPALAAGLGAVWLDRFAAGARVPDGAHRLESLHDLEPLLAQL